jgi:S-formylglutathione hydrolase FrmB
MLIQTHLFSKVLQQHTGMMLALPTEAGRVARRFPVLYLLHGGTEDSTVWFREVNVEAIAEGYGLIAVSIDAMSSSYADMAHGGAYFTYLTEEVPRVLAARLPISALRAETWIGGFSMGGHGALKATLRCPDQYGACIAMSGARDMVGLFQKWATMEGGPDLRGVTDALGPIDQIYGGENDLLALAERAAPHRDQLPRLYLSCGREDYAAPLSRAYHEHLLALGLSHDYYEAPGPHNYQVAERALRYALDQITKGGVCA